VLRPKTVLAFLVMALVPGISAGQTAVPDAGAPQLVRAAGMPLNDGALAPGMLTVRIVQGAFTSNLVDQVVEVEVAGGKVESARTGVDGRAQFAHLPVGTSVRASATVAGERLESEPFQMPAESGVRVLFVAGDGAAPATAAAPLEPGAWTAPHPVSVTSTAGQPAAPRPADTIVNVIRAVLVTTTVFAFGAMFLYRRQQRR